MDARALHALDDIVRRLDEARTRARDPGVERRWQAEFEQLQELQEAADRLVLALAYQAEMLQRRADDLT